MIDDKIRNVLTKRKQLHPEDLFATEECWKEEIEILSADIDQTIDFLLNRCTGEEFVWLSEVFEEVQERTVAEKLKQCIYKVAEKYPEETREYSILDFVINVEEE